MYFKSRQEAGEKLAAELAQRYRFENTVVLALTDGAVQVGAEIAKTLHTPLLMLLLTADIEIPGEGTLFGTLNQSGRFVYNGSFSAGEIEEYYSEFHGYLEDQKRIKMSGINHLLGAGGIVKEDFVRGHNVIVVSDGLSTGASLDAVSDFLKPLNILRLIVAAPLASVSGVDRAHIVADELHILSVTDNYFDTNHYYEVNDIPSHEATVALLDQIVLNWK